MTLTAKEINQLEQQAERIRDLEDQLAHAQAAEQQRAAEAVAHAEEAQRLRHEKWVRRQELRRYREEVGREISRAANAVLAISAHAEETVEFELAARARREKREAEQ